MAFRSALAVVMLACLASACGYGGLAANDYRGAVRAAQVRHEARLSDLTARATANLSGHPDAAALDLTALAGEITAFADDVQAVPAPDGDRAAASTLVAAYRRLGAATIALRDAVAARDRARLATALAAFNAAANGEAAAVDAFNGT
jgi:hypothetical protein